MAESSLLLHACCGPCATASAERLLDQGIEVTLLYSNANMAPREEWERRLEALERVARHYSVPLLVDARDHEAWLQAVKGHENEPERGSRCALCFRFSLDRTRRVLKGTLPVKQIGGGGQKKDAPGSWDAFATTLTVSPHKSSPLIFSVGSQWPEFSPWDFKKKDGYRRSLQLSRELELYRQDYCGCEFSLRDRERSRSTERP